MYIFIFISDGLEFTMEKRLASNSLCLHCVTLAGLELRDPPPCLPPVTTLISLYVLPM